MPNGNEQPALADFEQRNLPTKESFRWAEAFSIVNLLGIVDFYTSKLKLLTTVNGSEEQRV